MNKRDLNPRFYNIYYAMRKRCKNPKEINYFRYGARGIKCLWKSFEEFRDDMYESYLKHFAIYGTNTSIDRINNNGDYSKENCKWSTVKQQARNRRNNHILEFRGEKRCLNEWAEIRGIDRELIRGRLKLGWPVEKIFNTPIITKYRNHLC